MWGRQPQSSDDSAKPCRTLHAPKLSAVVRALSPARCPFRQPYWILIFPQSPTTPQTTPPSSLQPSKNPHSTNNGTQTPPNNHHPRCRPPQRHDLRPHHHLRSFSAHTTNVLTAHQARHESRRYLSVLTKQGSPLISIGKEQSPQRVRRAGDRARRMAKLC